MSKFAIKSTIFSVLFVLLFSIWGYYWSQFGIDLTDVGVTLYTQMKICKNSFINVSPTFFWIGSDLIGSFWLSLSNQPSLHFAKFGSYVLYGIIILINYYSTLNITQNLKYSIIVSIFSLLIFGSINIFPVINYDIAPLLPLSLFIYIYTSTLFKNQNTGLKYFLFGVVLCSLFLTRITLIPIIIISSFVIFKRNKFSLKYLFFFLIGVIIVILPFKYSTYTSNVSKIFFETLKQSINTFVFSQKKNPALSLFSANNYSFVDQIKFWTRGYFRILFITIFLFIVGYLVTTHLNKLFKNILYFVCTTFFLLFVFSPLSKFNFHSIDFTIIQSQLLYNYFLPSIIFPSIFFLLYKDKINRDLIILVLSIFIFFPLGSNSYEKKLSTTFPIVVPITFTLLYFFLDEYKNIFYHIYFKYFKLIIFPLIITTVVKANNTPYRDSPVSQLNEKFTYQSLIGIYSTHKKIEALSNTLNWINTNSNSNTKMLVLGKANMINYLTWVDGPFDYPYASYLDVIFIKEKIDLFKSGELSSPDLILIPLVDVSSLEWDYNSKKSDSSEFDFLINSFIKKKYILSYDNNSFKIYSLIKK